MKDSGTSSEAAPELFDRQEKCVEVYFLVFDTELLSNMITVNLDSSVGYMKHAGNFRGFLSFLNEAGYPDLGGRKVGIFGRQVL